MSVELALAADQSKKALIIGVGDLPFSEIQQHLDWWRNVRPLPNHRIILVPGTTTLEVDI